MQFTTNFGYNWELFETLANLQLCCRSNLDGIVEQMSFHECIKEMWSIECEHTVNDFVRNAAFPVAGR